MKESLQRRCSRFIEARDRIKAAFRWENSYIPPVCANLFCARDLQPDENRMRECRDLINRNTGLFSSFRGNIRIPLACLLSMEADPDTKLRRAQEIYQALRQFFHSSDYLALAAFLLTEYDCSEEKLSRGKNIYRMMKDAHPFLTSSEDSIFAVLMAWSDRPDEVLIGDMETCHGILKERFRDSNCVQSMTQILAMEGGDAAAKCGKVFALYDAIERQGKKYGKHHELATLAALAMPDADPEELARDIAEADSFLETQKGYGFWGVDKKARLMHAAMIVSDEYVPHENAERAALTGTIAMVIAQEMAMCAAIAAGAAASAASSSH